MCATLGRRVELHLDDERYERLAAEATRRGVSIGVLIRMAIDESLRRRLRIEAAEAILDAEPTPVPPGDGLIEEIHRLRDERHGDLY